MVRLCEGFDPWREPVLVMLLRGGHAIGNVRRKLIMRSMCYCSAEAGWMIRFAELISGCIMNLLMMAFLLAVFDSKMSCQGGHAERQKPSGLGLCVAMKSLVKLTS